MNIVGISAYYHDSACCLLQDGRLVAAAAEERFSRTKHDRRLPINAFKFCLKQGRIGINEIDCLAYYESPRKKLERQLWSAAPANLIANDAELPEREIREVLGYEGPIKFFEHHQSHAASTFFYSGFDEAAILTVDGVGEWATTTYGSGHDSTLEVFEEVRFPHSLGLLYSTITAYLGFRVNDGEYKVMGLAPYGSPRYLNEMDQLIHSAAKGQFALNLEYFDFLKGKRMYADAICDLFGSAPREKDGSLTQFHKDVARSLQQALENILLEKVEYLHQQTGSANLCLAGGVALNCVANQRIAAGPFANLFVQPAAGDDGGCLGAAALAHLELTRDRTREKLTHVFLGPSYESSVINEMLVSVGADPLNYRGRESVLLEDVADLLAHGKVIGWFHGAMEFGPRALGARSILADPRDAGMRERINRLVKKREAFRPFAPSVLLERSSELFELDHASPFMLETCAVKPGIDLPAVTHVDGSARPQTVDRSVAPRFAALIDAFNKRTGCPVLLNTSFNVRGEPIVCSPADALRCFIKADLDVLVLEDFIVEKEMISEELRDAVQRWYPDVAGVVPEINVYSFV
ncbi:MAG TPA: carbamoyltransferase [Pyrinomonadaceae bacterium]|nr:carbamoyltransferase [Pyrinomonadaceae bacterium]